MKSDDFKKFVFFSAADTEDFFRPLGFQKRKYQMLDQLLGPMRKLNIDISEFTAFKAIFFLNPGLCLSCCGSLTFF